MIDYIEQEQFKKVDINIDKEVLDYFNTFTSNQVRYFCLDILADKLLKLRKKSVMNYLLSIKSIIK